MNFFEHQEKARKQSRWIIVGFVVVTLLIVLAVNLLVLVATSLTPLSTSLSAVSVEGGRFFSLAIWQANAQLLLSCSAVTVGVIGLSSLGKITSLRSGGGKVARDMGGTFVMPDTRDPLQRRLYNVVEEISLASGTPVPEVYVLQNEPGINAFAAGYTVADAAIAVTRGTLEKLNRSELQGVIAHEFSHILNGDMRTNIRMMGVLFGILVIALIGRNFVSTRNRMSSAWHSRSTSSKNGGSLAVIAIGMALMLIGYIGSFFARWMQSALSRQREYLADASAVQFTRDPASISGALKKIAAYQHSSYLRADSAQVSHMLFSSGLRSFMFSTHPPLAERIGRIDKRYDENEIKQLAKKLQQQEKHEHLQASLAEQELANKEQGGTASANARNGDFNVDSVINAIGQPDAQMILAAGALAASLPTTLVSAAHSLEWVPEVLLYCLLSQDKQLCEQQLMLAMQQMGDISESKINHLLKVNGHITGQQRLPILEICFPTLKRRSIEDVEKILEMVKAFTQVDTKVDSFEYLLSSLIEQYLRESVVANRTRLHGKGLLKNCVQELSMVASVVASHGQSNRSGQGLQDTQKAYRAGMQSVGINHTNLNFSDNWPGDLDAALPILDKLKPQEKSRAVVALVRIAVDDRQITIAEHELLRVICALIHVPLPLL